VRDHGGVGRGAGGRLLAAETLACVIELEDEARPLYHAGAAIASTICDLHAVASDLRAAGAPPELVPLMRRTIENGFELTGPIERGTGRRSRRIATRSAPRDPTSNRCMTFARRAGEVRSLASGASPALRPVASDWFRRWVRSTMGTCP
jgi:hypothetical protein